MAYVVLKEKCEYCRVTISPQGMKNFPRCLIATRVDAGRQQGELIQSEARARLSVADRSLLE